MFAASAALVALGVTQALAQDAPRLNSALSCQLQIFQKDQHKYDLKAPFLPFVVRFDEGDWGVRSPTANFQIYDPKGLLKEAKPIGLFTHNNMLHVATNIDGPKGILIFSVTDFNSPINQAKPSFEGKSNWIAMVAMVGGDSYYLARGFCYYAKDVAGLDDEQLVIRKTN